MTLKIGSLNLEETSLVGTLILDFAINWGAWVFAALLKTEKFYDAVGTLSYTAVALSALINGGHYHARQIGVVTMILIWTWRLGTFLFVRVLVTKGDSRFDEAKTQPLKYLIYWTLQAVWVWICCLPATFLSARSENPAFGPTDVIGPIAFVLGFLFESIADFQKFRFKLNPDNRGKFISTGVWSLCRYPNYFGEICVWWGIFLSSLRGLENEAFVSVLSPVFVMFLLLFVSGIPIQEKQARNRWGEDPAYLQYRDRTPLLIPFTKIWKR